MLLTAFSLSTMVVTADQWWKFSVLFACGVLYTELPRRIERARQQLGVVHVNLESVWTFAATLLLPLGLTVVIIVVVAAQRWLRIRHHVVHRQVFSCAALVLATYGAVTVLDRFAFEPTGRTFDDFIVIACGAAVFHFLEWALVGVAIFLVATGPGRIVVAAGRALDHLVEAASIWLGFLLAWALLDWPVAGLAVLGVTFALHHVVLIRHLRDQARSDPKTGLLNADGFTEMANRELTRAARNGAHSTALLLIDLDHFKKINDTFGHVAGDEVLGAVARTMSAEARTYDLVCRFGGEEFLIMLPDTTTSEAAGVAERLRRRINDLVLPVTTGHHDAIVMDLTASIGIATHPHDGTTLDQLLQVADAAMYHAKNAGRNRTIIASEAGL